MTHFMRKVASNAIFVISRSSYGSLPIHVRSIFSSSGIGIDNFKIAREQHVSQHAQSLDGFKKRFLGTVQSGSQIFTEDLRSMIMSADTDEEVNSVVQALKQYTTNKLKFSDYHFGSPIMRLLYIQNKPELAMQLYMDEGLKDIFRDAGSALILLNKLVEEKRYDDAIKVFEYGSQRGFSTVSGRTYPTDVVMLAVEALYRQNTKQSLAKAKELITKVKERDSDINPRTATMIALLAVQQGEPAFAMEVLGAVRAQNLTTLQNIRAICYAEMGRVEEAINVVHLLADQPPVDNDRRRIFPLVLEYIRKAVDKSKDSEAKTRFDDLSKFIAQNDRLSSTDLTDFISEPVSRRAAILPGRQGSQQNQAGGYQRPGGNFRDTGFRGGYNQQSYNARQGSSDGRYNQQQYNPRQGAGSGGYNPRQGTGGYNSRQGVDGYNRPQSNRFGADNFDQRAQNTVGENQRSFRPENPLPSRPTEQNVSRQTGRKLGPAETTSTSPIPQRTTRYVEEPASQSKSSQNFNKPSSSFGKRDERQTGGNTGIQQQSPWSQGDGRLPE